MTSSPISTVFASHAPVLWPTTDEGAHFPVRRVFCIGRNYADHVTEMGGDAARSEPTVFTKDATCLVRPGDDVPYPPNTDDLHFEVELVVAMGPVGMGRGGAGGVGVWGHAVGIDLTRRDLQARAKAKGGPWDRAKSFPASAPMGVIRQGFVSPDAAISLTVNGQERQRSVLAKMIWGVGDIVSRLRADMDLAPGDLIFTGTPAGVGPVVAGDMMEAKVDGLPGLRVGIV